MGRRKDTAGPFKPSNCGLYVVICKFRKTPDRVFLKELFRHCPRIPLQIQEENQPLYFDMKVVGLCLLSPHQKNFSVAKVQRG
jgi:hypothetical protein